MTKRYIMVRNHVNLGEGTRPSVPNQFPNDLKRELLPPPGSDQRAFYKDNIRKFMDDDRYNIDSTQDMVSYMFDLQEQRFDCYVDELACFINFILISNQNSLLAIRQQQKDFLRFIVDQSDIFHALDIRITISPSNYIPQNYELVQNQIDLLDDDKRTIFWQIHKLYLQNFASASKKRDEVRAEEDAKRIRREQQAALEAARKQEELRILQERISQEEEMDLNQDLDSMVDSYYKYKIIVARGEKGGFPKFEDSQFKPEDSSIGDELMQYFPDGLEWKRMSAQDLNKKVFIDGVDATDIKQGACGDCYLLSAFAVMGNKFTREKFVFLNTEDEWKKTGAFCVRFFDDGKESFVIIDDKLPIDYSGEFVFGQSTNQEELWPSLLEKAYAKKYGSYAIIQGGHVHQALAELTNGVPRLILTEKEKNLEKLWSEMISYHKEGAMLGAGSNSHEDGDSATSPLGIVQGHAFSILNLVDADGYKLMQIRNPWGKGEWIGDWSDESDKWTTRLRNLVNWHETKDDGIFWIDLNDYVTEFDSIYICRDFSDRKVWNKIEVDDKWEGIYAEGLPNKENPKANMEKNPQYGLNITKPCHGIIVLRLKEKQDRTRAKHYGYFNMQGLEGGLISRPNKSKQLGFMGPRNDVVQAVEVDFSSEYSYPYVFTFIIANMKHGVEGEGGYNVQIFVKDFNASIDKINKIQ